MAALSESSGHLPKYVHDALLADPALVASVVTLLLEEHWLPASRQVSCQQVHQAPQIQSAVLVLYSCLNVMNGSTRDARRAGMKDAASATTMSNSAARA